MSGCVWVHCRAQRLVWNRRVRSSVAWKRKQTRWQPLLNNWSTGKSSYAWHNLPSQPWILFIFVPINASQAEIFSDCLSALFQVLHSPFLEITPLFLMSLVVLLCSFILHPFHIILSFLLLLSARKTWSSKHETWIWLRENCCKSNNRSFGNA